MIGQRRGDNIHGTDERGCNRSGLQIQQRKLQNGFEREVAIADEATTTE